MWIIFVGLLLMNPSAPVPSQNVPRLKLSPDNLMDVALQCFAQGPGRYEASREAGWRTAGEVALYRVESLSVGGTYERHTGGTVPWRRGENELRVGVDIPLANQPRRERAWISAEVLASGLSQQSQAFAYVEKTWALYGRAVLANHLVEHLTFWVAQNREWQSTWAKLAEDGVISQVDRLEQQAQLERFEEERLRWQQRAVQAEHALKVHLGHAVELRYPQWAEDPPVPPENPWPDLLAWEGQWPGEAALGARAKAEDRSADFLRSQASPTLTPNLTWREEPDGTSYTGVGVALTVLFRHREGRAYAVAKGEARALEAQRNWAGQARAMALQARSDQFEESRRQIQFIQDQQLKTLGDRLEALERGWQSGHVTVKRLLDARLAFHEAEHLQIELAVALWQDGKQAETVWTMLRKNGGGAP